MSFNTGEAISRLSEILGTKAGEITVALKEEKDEKSQLCGKKKRSCIYNRKRAVANKDYGPRVERPDANPNEMK